MAIKNSAPQIILMIVILTTKLQVFAREVISLLHHLACGGDR